MKLAQTLAGSWVITVPNPEERHWETQLAEFDMSAVAGSSKAEAALEAAAAAALATLARAFPHFTVEIVSHDPEAAARLRIAYGMHTAAETEIA